MMGGHQRSRLNLISFFLQQGWRKGKNINLSPQLTKDFNEEEPCLFATTGQLGSCCISVVVKEIRGTRMAVDTTADGDVVRHVGLIRLQTPQMETPTSEDDKYWMDNIGIPKMKNLPMPRR